MGEDVRRARFLREAVLERNGGFVHWIDALAEWIEKEIKKRGDTTIVFNGGLSVSGLQHVGRLRGEVVIPDVLAKLLREKGYKVRQLLTLYTQDAWKGKPSQIAVFRDKRGEDYRGWPLVKVPDPYGCHSSWVEHYWSDFGPYLDEFTSGRVEVVKTSDLYKERLREFIVRVFAARDVVRRVINKYRGRRPYPENWIPFEPVCSNCGRIDTTEALEYNADRAVVRYKCNYCGWMGEADISDGKLNWRIEWVGVWWALNVVFEPYGKDHATPGGSRDSANELAGVLGVKPPLGIPYEWVSLRTSSGEADMSSSDFIGFTPREWLEVAHPEVLRFLFIKTPPMKKLSLSLRDIPSYYQLYYRAERIYYGVESTGRKSEDYLLKRSYELSYTKRDPPPQIPSQPPYTHIAILVQILPTELWEKEGLRRLMKTGHFPENPTEFELERAISLFKKAENWVKKYAPSYFRFQVLEEPAEEELIYKYKNELEELASKLEELGDWSEESIKNVLIEHTKNWNREKRGEFYKAFYMLFFGKPEGPRAAPLLALLDRSFVVKRLRLEE